MKEGTVSVKSNDGWELSKKITYNDLSDYKQKMADFIDSPVRKAFLELTLDIRENMGDK